MSSHLSLDTSYRDKEPSPAKDRRSHDSPPEGIDDTDDIDGGVGGGRGDSGQVRDLKAELKYVQRRATAQLLATSVSLRTKTKEYVHVVCGLKMRS